MTVRKKPQKIDIRSAATHDTGSRRRPVASEHNDDIAREFIWDVVSISTYLEDIRQAWAKLLGVSGPQWLILMAINDTDTGNGVSVGDVSEKVHVQSTFVTAQTKSLERAGFLTRTVSAADARIVLMSLTDKARKEIAKLSTRQKKLAEFLFADLSEESLRNMTGKLSLIRNRAEKAALRLLIDDFP